MGQRGNDWESTEIGEEIGPLQKQPGRQQVERFCRLANLGLTFFLDEEMASKKGLPGPIVPGDISFCFIIQALSQAFPAAILRSIDVNFRQIVQHNDRLDCRAIVTDKGISPEGPYIDCDLSIQNQKGERTLLGRAKLLFPLP